MNLCIVNEDHPQCNVSRKAIKACPGRALDPLSHLESGHAVFFLHRMSVVRVYLSIAATTQDPAVQDLHHIIIKLPKVKDKERILKASRVKERVTYRGVPIRLSADFSKETLQARRGWKEVFEVMKGKDLHRRLLYPAKLSFRMEGKIKCFSDKVKLKEFIITKSSVYEMLKGLI